jgi:1-acyl-sn-glycerol-3-phosphate acyltransferase
MSKFLPKPRSDVYRPELTRLPEITRARRLFRKLIRGLARFLTWLFTRTVVIGFENFPAQGPALIVTNHLGDADTVVGLASTSAWIEAVAKVELYDYQFLRQILLAYGVIWIHRGSPDRRAIRAVLEGLGEGRFVAIAPEGRESLTGALEEGTSGAAYLAIKSKAPILPVTFTGTENSIVYTNMRRLRRSPVTITIGKLFWMEESKDSRSSIRAGTSLIMSKLAEQLPPHYRGVYAFSPGEKNE